MISVLVLRHSIEKHSNIEAKEEPLRCFLKFIGNILAWHAFVFGIYVSMGAIFLMQFLNFFVVPFTSLFHSNVFLTF